ncbi:MAG: YafY family transcriptional regulator [Rubrivivax sp.]|nr:YafY family transcriptional regulator [Rubrivivax sp.]
MDRTERLYQIERLIRHRGQVSFAALQEALEVSRATLWRDIEYLRSRLGAPIEYDRFANGYRFASPAGAARGQAHELPGMWFSERELYSLLMAHQLLAELDSDGLLSRHLQPLLERIHALLADGSPDEAAGPPALTQRVRIISAARRPVAARCFERVGEALMKRQRLHLRYLTRGRGESGEREVSPQRLVHHRNTWYLDAWCHRVQALRRFSLDAIEEAALLPARAHELALATVRAQMDAGYGIYAGGRRRWARLRFAPQAARWISREQWHPEQQGHWREDGSWELRLPYVNQTELVMDLLRQGPEVTVLAPASLREAVRERLSAALALYAPDAPGRLTRRANPETAPAPGRRRRAPSA